jgi:hypothetical protein
VHSPYAEGESDLDLAPGTFAVKEAKALQNIGKPTTTSLIYDFIYIKVAIATALVRTRNLYVQYLMTVLSSCWAVNC